ncbi:MAG: PTS sugar transporter subunit IIA [Candidatus Eiseniibacteriota bacterium]
MDLSTREVARLLGVTEQVVNRWLRDKAIPAHRLHDQPRFNRVEIQEWAAARGIRLSPETAGPDRAPAASSSLRAAVERGGIYYDLPGTSSTEVLEAVTQLPGIPEGVDRDLLRQLLVGREALMSTGIGGGIAIPHPRDPVVIHTPEPIVLTCFLKSAVDFHAIDAAPVRVIFALLSPSIRAHLRILARLTYALHDAALLEMLEKRAAPAAILDRLAVIEAQEQAPQP